MARTASWTSWITRGVVAAGAVAAFAMLAVSPAQAGSCPVGQSCTFSFSNTNQTGVTVGIDVTINNTGSDTILTFSYDPLLTNISNQPLGIDQIAFNSGTSLPTSFATGFSLDNCSTNPAPCQMDGFGAFDASVSSPGGTLLSGISFTFDSLITNFADNATGGEFAVHIRFNGCSAFVSDGTNSDTSTTNCTLGPPFLVPEPASLSLMGLALFGLVGVLRRRRS